MDDRAKTTPIYDFVHPRQERFLRCIEQSGRIVDAARWAKVSRQAHYAWLREDPSYPDRFKAALKAAAGTLADEAIRRGRDGVKRAIYYKGKIVGYETVYSDVCLLRMAEALDPERFSPRLKQQHTGEDDKPLLDLEAFRAYMLQAPEDGEAAG